MTIAILTNDQSGMVLDAATSNSGCQQPAVQRRLHMRNEKRSLKDKAQQATHKLTLSCSAITHQNQGIFYSLL